MNKQKYYNKTYNYYENVKNLWGDITGHPYLIEGFKFSSDIKEHAKIISQYADLKENQDVLDCGCGFGQLITILNSLIPAKYTGITLNDYHIQNKKNNNVLKVNFENLNIFSSNSFDRVLFIESFSHSFNKNNVLREVYRILKPSGKLFILDSSVSDEDYIRIFKESSYRKYYKSHIDYYGDKPICKKYFFKLAEKNNFSLLSYEEDIDNKLNVDLALNNEIILFQRFKTFCNYYLLQKD
jgi:SAM-dependent methyltransferase